MIHPEPDVVNADLQRVAYVMSRFPKLTETFILYEILALEASGVEIHLYPLLRERSALMQPEARRLVEAAHYLPFLSTGILGSQLRLMLSQPRTYLSTLLAVIRGTWGSLNFLTGALAIFPKVCHAARLMKASGISHVHCHFANHPAVAGFIIHRLTEISYSFTAHGSDLHMDRHMLCEKVAEASFVVPISEYNRELILAECDGRWADKLFVIHCGVDTDVFRPAAPLRSSGRFTIVCIGTLHEVKGHRYLIEACGLLAEQNVDFECHLIGDGEDRPALMKHVRDAGLETRVIFQGKLTRAQIAEHLHRADVLVAPSVPTRSGKREGIPVVLMEAMSTGLPVVASRISGIPELVSDGRSGLLVAPRDAPALAQALRLLHDSPSLRRRLGEAGRETVRRDFDIRRNATRLLQKIARAAA